MSSTDPPRRPFGLQWFPSWSLVVMYWGGATIQSPPSSLVNHLTSDQMGNPAMIHWNERLWKADFWKSLTHSVTYRLQKVHLNKTDHKAKWLNQNKASLLAILEDFNVNSINLFSDVRVIAQWLYALSLPEAPCRREHVVAERVETEFWYSLLQANQVLPLFVPSAQMFPLWHVVFICWTPESVSLSSFLKPLCQSNVF